MRIGPRRIQRTLAVVMLAFLALLLLRLVAPESTAVMVLHDFNPNPEPSIGWDGGNLGGGSYTP